MPTDEMIPMPPLRLGPADLVELFAAAVDRPLFLACREVSCAGPRCAIYITSLASTALFGLLDWYLAVREPECPAIRPMHRALGAAAWFAEDACSWACDLADRVTDYWRERSEPVRFGQVLTGFRHRVARHRPLGAQVA